MMKKIIFTLTILAMVPLGWSQSISNQVIGSVGYSATAGGNMLDFTVGELVVQTLNASGTMLSQGFHQTYQGSASIDGEDEISLTIDVYPNPTFNEVNVLVKTEKLIEMNIVLLDGYGKLMMNELYTSSTSTKIDLSKLSAGTYYLRLSKGDIHIRTIKIQKLSN